MSSPDLLRLPGVLQVPGVRVGVVTDQARATGVTALVLPPGATGAVVVQGGAPATRETDCLRPGNLVAGPDAVLLAGGSAFGLAAADGAVLALARQGRGVEVRGVHVPIVPAAAIFDLHYGASAWPSAEDGRRAVESALAGEPSQVEGSVGAGTGATVGKLLGLDHAMKGGQGAVTLARTGGLAVAALAVVNALGSVVAEDGSVLAGTRDASGRVYQADELLTLLARAQPSPGEATTLVAVVTSARLGQGEALRVARMAHDGIARAIVPAHTLWDGDTVFVAATGEVRAEVSYVGALAQAATAEAIRRAVARP